MIAKATDMIGTTAGFLLVPIFMLLPVGGLYWIWMSVQLGSFMMFVLGVLGPTVLITAPVGLYSLLFGVPAWVLNMFT